MKIIQNRTHKSESESESEEGEIDKESDFEMENPDTSERNGPINTNPEDELRLHTDGEMPTGENENKFLETEKSPVRRSSRKCSQPNLYGGVRYTKNFWL